MGRDFATVLTSAVLGAALAGCGSSASKISADKVQQAADQAINTQTTQCPLGIDINAALKKAGVAATATPAAGAQTDSGEPAVYAESATKEKDDSPLKQRGGALITCTYVLSTGGSVQARLIAVHTGTAIALMAPQLQHDAEISVSDLRDLVTRKLEAGKPVVTPGPGLAAIAKLDASGGDALLETTSINAQSSDETGPIVGDPLGKLTEALAKQIHL